MKVLPLSILLFVSIHSSCQTSISQSGKIATFCKVWGFLKYHHPSVAKGKYDWDQEFFDKLKIIEHLDTKQEMNQFYEQWISGLGKLDPDAKRIVPPDAILSNYEFSWLKDTSVFTTPVMELFLQVQNNTLSKNHYLKNKFFGLASLSYVNEKPYADSLNPSKALRLLTLARYWNIVNYFYPYKYLTDKKWKDVLPDFVPKFIDAGNTKDYHRTVLQLFATINDTHTAFNPQLYRVGLKIPPFYNKIVDDKIVILDLYNDSLCKKSDIRYGDVILKINNQSIKSLIDYFSRYASVSNYASLCNLLAPQWIWAGIADSTVITCEREGRIFEKILPEYSLALLLKDASRFGGTDMIAKADHQIFKNNIGYINLGKIKSKGDAKQALKNITATDAAILDLRNYPKSSIFGTITDFFCASRQPFVMFAKQSIKYPGVLTWSKVTYCGKNGGGSYKGKVAVLIDESTISFAEYFTMALKTIPNVILIGSHTAGADGTNTRFVLPGNIPANFSNEAVYYPDGGETQRKGIVPDVTVLPTIEGIRSRKDEVLAKAIEILSR